MENMDWEDDYMTPPKVLNKPVGNPEPKMSEFTQAYFEKLSPKTLEEVCQVAEAVAQEDEDSEGSSKSPVVGYSFSSDDDGLSTASSDTDPLLDELNRRAFNRITTVATPKTKARNRLRQKRVNKLRKKEEVEEDRFLAGISTSYFTTENDDHVQTNQNPDTSKSIPKPGFSTASGKTISVSTEAIEKGKRIWKETETVQGVSVHTPNIGFNSATDKDFPVPPEAKEKPQVTKNEEEESNDWPITPQIPSKGFATASGKNITVSTESIKKAQHLWKTTEVEENNFIEEKPNPMPGFATAGGRNISVSKESLKKAQNLWENIEVKESDLIEENPMPATAGGKNIPMSTDSIKKFQSLWKNKEVTDTDFIEQKPSAAPGFSTASGKNISVSTESLIKAQNVWENIEVTDKDFIEKQPSTPPGFATASGKNILVSKESLIKAQNVWENIEVTDKDFMEKKPSTPPGFATASGKNILVSKESLKKAQNLWEHTEVTDKDFMEQKQNGVSEFAAESGKDISESMETLKGQNLSKSRNGEELQKCSTSLYSVTSGSNIIPSHEAMEVDIEESGKEEVNGLENIFGCDKLGDSRSSVAKDVKDDEIKKDIDDCLHALLADEANGQLCQSNQEEHLKTESQVSKGSLETGPNKISSITYDQKTVALINVYLARIYPPVYIHKNPDGKTVVLSQRQFESHQKKQDTENDVEKILAEIEKDIRNQHSNKSGPKKYRLSSLNKSALNKMSPDSILDLMEGSDDAMSIESMLSPAILNGVHEAKLVREDSIRSAIQSQFEAQRKKLMAAQPTQVVKMLVLDTSSKGDITDCKNCAFISLWRPPETLLSSLKEGEVYEISNLTTNSKLQREIIQLNTTIRTQFRTMDMSTNIFRKANRICHAISDVITPDFSPIFKEIDVVGLVVSVRPVMGNTGQPVYVSDENNNFLEIRFWNSVTDQLLDDVFQQGTFLSIYNLQWRPSSHKHIIPIAYFQETSIFKTNPKESVMCTALNNLKKNIQDPKSFASSSEMILFSRLDSNSKLSKGNTSFNSSFNARTPQTPTLSIGNEANFNVTPTGTYNSAKRIKLLESYGDPPPIPQLPMVKTPRVLGKFIPPMKK